VWEGKCCVNRGRFGQNAIWEPKPVAGRCGVGRKKEKNRGGDRRVGQSAPDFKGTCSFSKKGIPSKKTKKRIGMRGLWEEYR